MQGLSAQDVERFTPEKYLVDGQVPVGAPIYLLAPLTWRERARWRAALTAEGVRFPQDAEVAKAVRSAIVELQPSNAADLLASVQAFEDVLETPPVLGEAELSKEAAEPTEDQKAEIDRRRAVIADYEVLVDRLRQAPAVGSLLGLRVLYYEVAPPLAAAFALRGWEGVRAPFERAAGVVSDRALTALGEDLAAVGSRAMSMLTVTSAQKGN